MILQIGQFETFKKWFSHYENAEILQTISLILFVLFFVAVIAFVYTRPKSYYKEVSESPLEQDDILELEKFDPLKS